MKSRIKKIIINLLGTVASIGYDRCDTVFVSGTGRSGTTWVAEVLSKQMNFTLVNEPFNVGPNQEWRPSEFGFEKVNYWPQSIDKECKKYINNVAFGKELHLSWGDFDPLEFATSNGYVVKAVLVNPCFAKVLKVTGSPGVFLIRHPCGVVSSQQNHPGWAHFSKQSRKLPAEVARDYPRFEAVFNSISSQLEVLAFWWAVENIIPLRTPRPHPWELVSYESLVRDPVGEFARLIESVDGESPSLKQLKRDVQKPSSSTREYSQPGKSPTSIWKERLSPKEVDTIYRVVEECGFERWDLFE